MNNTTKTILYVVGGIAVGVGIYFLYNKFVKKDDVKGEGEVSANSKKKNKIIFTRE
jgi:hypothetical protein